MKTSTLQWLELAQADLRSCENNLHDDFVTNIQNRNDGNRQANISRKQRTI